MTLQPWPKKKRRPAFQTETPRGFVSVFENTSPNDDDVEDTSRNWASEDYDGFSDESMDPDD